MKKLYLFVLMTFCMFIFHAKGQSSVGVKADVNLSSFWINQSTNLISSMKAGCSAGFFYKYAYRENAAVQADMMFRYRSSEIKNQITGETGDFSYFGIELPVYALRQAEIDNQILYFGIGAFASFGMFCRNKTADRSINPYKKDQIGDKSILHRWDFGVGFIIGYEMKCRLQINFNYQMGVRNLVDDGFENVNMISALGSLGVGHRF
jgi:hypothetical protein